MTTTRLYLDVDGVINAIPAAQDRVERTGWSDWDSTWVGLDNGGRYWITWALGFLDALHTIDKRDDVEIVWLTTWRTAAVTKLSPALGINGTHWHVADDDVVDRVAHGYMPMGFSDYGWWWKASAIAGHLDKNPVDQVVWLDDDHNVFSDAVKFVHDRFQDTDFLMITPDTRYGVTQEDVARITNFIDGLDLDPENVV
jgi:hypothetical protein